MENAEDKYFQTNVDSFIESIKKEAFVKGYDFNNFDNIEKLLEYCKHAANKLNEKIKYDKNKEIVQLKSEKLLLEEQLVVKTIQRYCLKDKKVFFDDFYNFIDKFKDERKSDEYILENLRKYLEIHKDLTEKEKQNFDLSKFEAKEEHASLVSKYYADKINRATLYMSSLGGILHSFELKYILSPVEKWVLILSNNINRVIFLIFTILFWLLEVFFGYAAFDKYFEVFSTREIWFVNLAILNKIVSGLMIFVLGTAITWIFKMMIQRLLEFGIVINRDDAQPYEERIYPDHNLSTKNRSAKNYKLFFAKIIKVIKYVYGFDGPISKKYSVLNSYLYIFYSLTSVFLILVFAITRIEEANQTGWNKLFISVMLITIGFLLPMGAGFGLFIFSSLKSIIQKNKNVILYTSDFISTKEYNKTSFDLKKYLSELKAKIKLFSKSGVLDNIKINYDISENENNILSAKAKLKETSDKLEFESNIENFIISDEKYESVFLENYNRAQDELLSNPEVKYIRKLYKSLITDYNEKNI
jgi:hypothetical protein